MARASKKAMVEFLQKHPRYTDHGQSYYQASVKLYLWVPAELRETAYELLDVREPYADMEFGPFADFAEKHQGYCIGFMGRMGGHAVLCRVSSCRGTELEGSDSYENVKDLYDMVKDFDAAVEEAKEIFLDYCRNYTVEEEVVQVPTKVKVLKEREGVAA